MKGSLKKMTAGERSVIGDTSKQEGAIWRENFPDRRKSKCKGPEVGTCLMCLCYNEVVRVAGGE